MTEIRKGYNIQGWRVWGKCTLSVAIYGSVVSM